MKKVLGGILLVVYSIIAITVTVLLLSYNDYNCSEIGGYTVYIVNDDSLEPKYKQGSILLIKGTNDKNIQIGDEMILYKVLNSQEYEVVTRTLADKQQQGRHIVYSVEDSESYSSDYFIGKTSDTVIIEGWGYILGLLESKWGYLFCVVIVSLLLFLQEVFELVMEIKYGGGKSNKNKAKEAVEVEAEVEEEENEEPEQVKTTRKAPTKSTNSTSTAKKTGTTAHKTSTSKVASTTARKTSTAKVATTKKAGTTKKASTTPKTTTGTKRATKSSKEEE